MRKGQATTIGLMLAAMLAACSQSAPPENTEVAQPAEDTATSLPVETLPAPAPAQTVAAPDAPSGNVVAYACEDGSGVTVTYDGANALVKLPTGSTMLPRADEASKNGTDAYLGEEVSLYRNGDMVQLQVAGQPRICNQS